MKYTREIKSETGTCIWHYDTDITIRGPIEVDIVDNIQMEDDKPTKRELRKQLKEQQKRDRAEEKRSIKDEKRMNKFLAKQKKKEDKEARKKQKTKKSKVTSNQFFSYEN